MNKNKEKTLNYEVCQKKKKLTDIVPIKSILVPGCTTAKTCEG